MLTSQQGGWECRKPPPAAPAGGGVSSAGEKSEGLRVLPYSPYTN